jgi:hypothetical protein
VFWQYPNIDTSLGGYAVSDARGMCSLYVRLCEVADSVIETVADSNRVLVLSASVDSAPYKEWLKTFFDIATQNGGPGVFWDGVSVHPYQALSVPSGYFSPSRFEADAETVRAVMHGHGDYGELWITEVGWPYNDPRVSEQQQAHFLSEVFTSAKATEASPTGGYDQMCWYSFLDDGAGCGVLRPESLGYACRPAAYASGQTADFLVGKRLNGRVMFGDSLDSIIRAYEFETTDGNPKKLWVCWQHWPPGTDEPPNPPEPELARVRLPVRSDMVDTAALAYAENPPAGQKEAATDGWLDQWLGLRPVFITEPEGESISRPDLVVDSIACSPQQLQITKPMNLYARVKNTGNDSTPDTTLVRFLWNDSVYTTAVIGSSIPAESSRSVLLIGGIVPAWMHGTGLLTARANPGQQYVEKDGLDDNAAYLLKYAAWPPTGVVDVVVPPGGMTNVPLVLFKLSSASMELDTTAQTPCDSERLLQVYFGISDTTAEDADTTAWFKCVADTSWTFLHGQGRYRCYLQVKDSWSESAWSADSVDSVVVFDTTAPSGTVTINSGARFTDTTGVLLYSGMTDSVSPLNAMRAGSLRLANIVENSGFDSQDGGWFFSNGQYDNNLGMAELTVTSNQSSLVAESIPVGSISPYYYDSCRLAADLLMHVHNAPESGKVFFCYYYAKPSPIMKDTIWQTRASVRFGACPQLS